MWDGLAQIIVLDVMMIQEIYNLVKEKKHAFVET